MRFVTLVGVLLLAIPLCTNAQYSNSVALGARLSPDGGGFSVRYYSTNSIAFELQLNGSGGYYNSADDGPSAAVVGLLEYNIIFHDPSWRIFLGPGIHAGTWDRYNNSLYEYRRTSQGIFGIDGIFGVEYILKSIPLGFAADIKPAMNFASDVAFFPNNMFGLSARYFFTNKMLHKKRHSARE